jgi:hypothetical protein
MALFIFEHIPSPWGAGTLPDGCGKSEAEMEGIGSWQAHVVLSTMGTVLMGALFLFAGCVLLVISRLGTKTKTNYVRIRRMIASSTSCQYALFYGISAVFVPVA